VRVSCLKVEQHLKELSGDRVTFFARSVRGRVSGSKDRDAKAAHQLVPWSSAQPIRTSANAHGLAQET